MSTGSRCQLGTGSFPLVEARGHLRPTGIEYRAQHTCARSHFEKLAGIAHVVVEIAFERVHLLCMSREQMTALFIPSAGGSAS